jgi:serine/threonine-protein kinase
MLQVAAPSRLAVLLFTDIVGSTELKGRIGSLAYWQLLQRHNELFEQVCADCRDGEILKHTGDGYLATFQKPSDAVKVALMFQEAMSGEPWEPSLSARIGIASGEVALVEMAGRRDVVGTGVDLAARVMSLAVGGQILITGEVYESAWHFVPAHPARNGGSPKQLKWLKHGRYLVKGSETPLEVCEVGADGSAPCVAPGQDRQPDAPEQEEIPPWRPDCGLEVPTRNGWVLERKIGEGGFGEVWLAREPHLRQRVFKFCFDPDRLRSFKRELTLFERMRQLDRGDIAKVVDVQLHQPPFFLVSEYAAGGNLAEWADREGGLARIPLRDRLEIVVRIADAVAAAHSVGVLHKDIKPANILVDRLPDGDIRPRISDFGIGFIFKTIELERRGLTHKSLAETTLSRSDGSGAVMYAPPELLAGREFTTQGDVYALGVLLYQMVLSDLSRPIAPGWESDIEDELLRELIGDCVDGHLERRLAGAAPIAERLRGLESDREARRRVRGAAERARQRKVLLRWMAGASGVLAIAAVLVTFWGFWQRSIATERAKQRDALAKQTELSEAALTLYIKEGERDEPMAKATLRSAVQSLKEGAFDNPPVRGAKLRQTLGNFYRKRREFNDAEPLLEESLLIRRRELPQGHPDIAWSLNDLGQLFQDQGLACADAGETAKAEHFFEKAERHYQEALRIRERLGPEFRQHRAASYTTLGDLYRSRGKAQLAEPLLRRAMEETRQMDANRLNVAGSIFNYARLLQDQLAFSEAEPLFREALEICEQGLDAGHPKIGEIAGHLALCLEAQHKPGAEALLERAEQIFRAAGEAESVRWIEGHLARIRARRTQDSDGHR